MKLIFTSFKQFIKIMSKEIMFLLCLIAPVIICVALYFIIPTLENVLCQAFEVDNFLSTYYLLIDLLIFAMIPTILCYPGLLIILEELDTGLASYLTVTPLNKNGYLFSRIGIPIFISVFYSVFLFNIFSLSNISFTIILLLSIINIPLTGITSFFVLSFAKNKVEGMALLKLSNILILGLIPPFFIHHPLLNLIGALPSYWIGKFATDSYSWIYIVLYCVVSIFWLYFLYNQFNKKRMN